MTDRRRHLEEALRACAEAGAQDSGDPWPAIRERAGERLGGRAANSGRRWRLRLLPRTRAGWVLATLLVLLFGTAAYAVSGLTESGLTIEEASLRSGEQGDEIVVRVHATGSANLPECFLVEGPTMGAIRRFEDGGEPPKGRVDSVWPDDDLTASSGLGTDTTTFVFREDVDPAKDAADPRRTPFFAVCSAGTGPGGTGPGGRYDEAHVAGTPEGDIPPPPEEQGFVRKDMSAQEIRPPVATLSSGKDSVEGAAGPYCWSPGSRSEEENVLWCWNEAGVEDQVPHKEDTLSVAAGSTMALSFGGRPKLDSVLAGVDPLYHGRLTGNVPGGKEPKVLRTTRRDGRIEIPADLSTGEYLLSVHVSGLEGEADYAFRVAVERGPGGRS